MNLHTLKHLFLVPIVLVGLSSCSRMETAMSLFEQLGGMETVGQLANGFVRNMTANPNLSGLLSGVNASSATSKMTDQLCAALGGGCTPPFSADQIASAAGKLSPEQKSAVSSSFASALNAVASSPALRDTITKTLGPQLGGIVGSLL
jgi:truncated hemoglobin YjbI